jgi:hypothetical protein
MTDLKKTSDIFHDVYSQSQQFLGSVYLNKSTGKWAIKEHPGHWFDSEEEAQAWLISRNEPTSKG